MPEAPKSNLEHRKAREHLALPQGEVRAGISVLLASLAGPIPASEYMRLDPSR